MRKAISASVLAALICIGRPAISQFMTIGEVVIVNYPALKTGLSVEAFKSYFDKNIARASNNQHGEANFQLFQADRGKDNGRLLMVCSMNSMADRKLSGFSGSPFADEVLGKRTREKPSAFMTNADTFIEYHILSDNSANALHPAGILGIHYLKVKKERASAFENFVRTKMDPSVGRLLPDMHLVTYKAVNSGQEGNYITIFAIKSPRSRDKYWPSGKPETEELKAAFRPLGELSSELKEYLEPGSYLEPSGGAAAIFESKEWTDYVLSSPANNN